MSSNLGTAITGLGTVLVNGVPGLHTYDHPALAVNEFPAAVVLVDDFDPRLTFGGNSWMMKLRVVLLLSRIGDSDAGYDQLYDNIDPTAASNSIIKAIRTDPTLNGSVDDAEVASVENVGLRELGGIRYIGADFIIEAVKSVA